MKLYKFRKLENCNDLERIRDIIENGFYCNNFISFNDMNEGIYQHCDLSNVNLLPEKLEYKICSFSEERALFSELMWGHYADAGKGIAIEITLSEDEMNQFKKVTYTNNIPCENIDIKDILSTKSCAWSYEHEYRYLSTETLGNNKVNIGEITKIYFGTPFENLLNYGDILAANKKLQKYHFLRRELECFLESCDICYSSFNFEGLES